MSLAPELRVPDPPAYNRRLNELRVLCQGCQQLPTANRASNRVIAALGLRSSTSLLDDAEQSSRKKGSDLTKSGAVSTAVNALAQPQPQPYAPPEMAAAVEDSKV